MRFLSACYLCLVVSLNAIAAPVEFAFRVPAETGNPFAREVWGEVVLPHQETQIVPAFYRGNGEWAVRVRAARAGEYRLGAVTESKASLVVPVAAEPVSPTSLHVATADPSAGPIRIDPRRPRDFTDGTGERFVPFGVNLPWPDLEADPDEYYPATFATAAAAGMNWTRVWMAHWSGLNLDWRPADAGPSPPLGSLALEVAARWDRLIAAAEEHGLRVQVVLQHHGQYSSSVNPNWDINPWSAANGGFLDKPEDFFTSPRARELTRRKLRYIVARWGYSPAIFAWELFNEVRWTDARLGGPEANRMVAGWHAEMARYIRSLDTERHLVTTSDDNLSHPLQDAMDFLQPHLYARNMLAAVRRFDARPELLDRPVFYGEVGEDNVPGLEPAFLESGAASLPIAWAGLMGEGPFPAQLWYAHRLARSGRFDELGALARFIRSSGLDTGASFEAFSPAITSDQRQPYQIEPGMNWHRLPPPPIHVPFDGSAPAGLGEVPTALVPVDDPRGAHEPYPSSVTLLLDYPRDATAVLRFSDAHPDGASVRVRLDGKIVAEYDWPRLPDNRRDPPAPRPNEFVLPMKPGRRTLEIENPRGPEWVGIDRLRTGLDVPRIAAAGKRTDNRIVLWMYHRVGVFSATPPPPAQATLHLPNVPAGRWRVTWWDVVHGEPTAVSNIDHPGGTLDLETPPVTRHTAAWLESRAGL